MIRAALFDMDGLLLDSERIYGESALYAAQKLGYTITWEMVVACIGKNDVDTNAYFARTNPGLDGEAMNRARDEFLKAGGYIEVMPLKPYAAEILQHLTARGIRCAVVTSTVRALAEPHLRIPGLLPYFEQVVTGDQIARGKPAPDGYLKAIEMLSVRPEECAVLEDSYNGLRAGRAAGAMTIMVPDLLPCTEEIRPCCDHVVSSLREAEAIICR